ncbi:MAG: molybdopterin molybdotransferase MoeA [Solirubrobacteraceae bacterium]
MAAALISVSQARAIVSSVARRLDEERIDIADALDRVLARDLLATCAAPPFACAAMDGYAVAPGPGARRLHVVGESRAGAPCDRGLAGGDAIRISTGAVVPAGAGAVIRQEDVQAHGPEIHTQSAVAPGANIREAAEDLRAGATVLRAGVVLGPAELGAGVVAGAGRLDVVRRPRVGLLCTGEELRAAGEPLGPGEIHNCNGPMLAALASRSGATLAGVECLPDDRAGTEAWLLAILDGVDLVIVSGGVGSGPHDHVRHALAALGVRERFWGVALAPGMPTWFGEHEGGLVFALPGNPVSSFVTFSLFTALALGTLGGITPGPPRDARARLGVAVRRKPTRELALRVRLERDEAGAVAYPHGPQNSHLVTSLLGAEAFALIPAGEGIMEVGSSVALEPFPR